MAYIVTYGGKRIKVDSKTAGGASKKTSPKPISYRQIAAQEGSLDRYDKFMEMSRYYEKYRGRNFASDFGYKSRQAAALSYARNPRGQVARMYNAAKYTRKTESPEVTIAAAKFQPLLKGHGSQEFMVNGQKTTLQEQFQRYRKGEITLKEYEGIVADYKQTDEYKRRSWQYYEAHDLTFEDIFG